MICGIVSYNPDIIRIKKCIDAIYNQVEKVIIVDNKSNNRKEIKKILSKYKNIVFVQNDENFGIAYALNQIAKYSINNGYKWFLTLDQDTIVNSNLIKIYKKFLDYNNVGMICSNYIDDNLDNHNISYNEELDFTYEKKCITSGTLNNTDAIIKSGGFDDKMFIDCVDFDMCTSLIEKKYTIIKIQCCGFHHTVGQSKVIKFLFKKIILYNESPLRVYYYVRNKLYYIKKHKKNINVLKDYLSLIKKILIIVCFEQNRKEKIKCIIIGIRDYRKNIMGRKDKI